MSAEYRIKDILDLPKNQLLLSLDNEYSGLKRKELQMIVLYNLYLLQYLTEYQKVILNSKAF